MSSANVDNPINYVFSNVGLALLDEINLDGTLSKLEDDVVEYKSRDVFSGGNDKVISTLEDDVRNALKPHPLAVLIVGVEDDGTIDALPSARVGSDRLEAIREGLARELNIEQVYLPSIASDGGSLVLVVAHTK